MHKISEVIRIGLFDGFGKRAAETRKNSRSAKKMIEEERKEREKGWKKIAEKYNIDIDKEGPTSK